MTVSLIIPTFNKSPRLRIALESIKILNSQYLKELIIVNDGSDDDTESIIGDFINTYSFPFRIRVINIKNSGRSIARNVGAENSKGDLLVFADDDVILTPDFINEHFFQHGLYNKEIIVRGTILDLPFIKFFKNPITGELFDKNQVIRKNLLGRCISLSMIEPTLKELMKETRLSKFEKDILKIYDETNIWHRLRWIGCTGANISMTKKTFESISGFDTNLGKSWGCEDLELGYRLKQKGCNFIHAAKAVNIHLTHLRADYESSHQKAMKYFYQKHLSQEIEMLDRYFRLEIGSLLEWKESTEK